MIEHIEFIVEEPSAEAALQAFLPRFLHAVTFAIYPHQGKVDLLAKLPSRMKGYSRWLPGNWRVIVLIDRDDDDCLGLKQRMNEIARDAGLLGGGTRESRDVVNRIAIEELEAWYFGDWQAVCQAYPGLPTTIPARRGYRDPDAIAGGTSEALERILQRGGYMDGGLRKIEAAREIGGCLDPERNSSRSFRHFWRAVTTP